MSESLELRKVDAAVPSCACPGLRLPALPGSKERGCDNATLINNRAVKAIFNENFVRRHFREGHPCATRLCR